MEPSEIATSGLPSAETVEKVKRLLDVLATSKRTPREEATLLAMGEDAAKAVNDVLLPKVIAWKRRTRRFYLRSLIYMLGFVTTCVAGAFDAVVTSNGHFSPIALSVIALLMLAMFCEAALRENTSNKASRAFLAVLDVVARMPGRALVPLWLELCTFPQPVDLVSVRHVSSQKIVQYVSCQKILREMLNSVQKSDARYFSSKERTQLNRILGNSARFASTQKPELTLAVLRVLETLEDTSAVPTIEYLAAQGSTPRISKAASASLSRMKKQAAAPAHMLLRGSSSPEDQSEVLLRAASGNNGTPQEELLRAAGAEPARIEIPAAEPSVSVHVGNGSSPP